MIDVSFDATLRRSSRSIRQSLLLTISVENQWKIKSKIAYQCGFSPKSAATTILGAFLAPFSPLGGAFGRFWVTLADPWGSPGRPWGAPEVPWEPLGPPPGLPGDPPWIHLGPSWAPWASRGGSGRVLASQNHEKLINFGRCLHPFSVPKSVANLVVCAPMLVPKSLSKRVWPSILDRWLRRFGGCFSILGGIEVRRRQRRGGWEHRRHNTMSRSRRMAPTTPQHDAARRKPRIESSIYIYTDGGPCLPFIYLLTALI